MSDTRVFDSKDLNEVQEWLRSEGLKLTRLGWLSAARAGGISFQGGRHHGWHRSIPSGTTASARAA